MSICFRILWQGYHLASHSDPWAMAVFVSTNEKHKVAHENSGLGRCFPVCLSRLIMFYHTWPKKMKTCSFLESYALNHFFILRSSVTKPFRSDDQLHPGDVFSIQTHQSSPVRRTPCSESARNMAERKKCTTGNFSNLFPRIFWNQTFESPESRWYTK